MTVIPMHIMSEDLSFPMSVALKYEAALLPGYDGAVEFTPSDSEQTVHTANKSVYSDITIKPIPQSGTAIATGTIAGTGTPQLQIPCEFEPDLIYVIGDLTGDPSLRGVVSMTIIKDGELVFTADASASSTTETMAYSAHFITGYNDTSAPHAAYSDGVLTLDTVNDTSSYRFNSSVTYDYKLVKWTQEGGEE